MAGFGFGLGFRVAHARKQGGNKPYEIPIVSPAAGWDGSAGSGFASTPSDPVRTTAKPAMRLLVLPNQFFDGELLVGVYAGANDGGSLYTNMGLSHVTLHFEGTSTSITQPSLATFNDANGNPVTYFGWWAKLQKPAGISGEAQLYFEAVPRDTSMQSRVIGPYSFFPHNVFPATGTLHDYELAVAPNQAQIAGQRYTSFANALGFLRNESLSNTLWNPRITCTEGGTIDLTATFWVVPIKGWTTVEASQPIIIAKDDAVRDTDTNFRPKLGSFRFQGSNITFDSSNVLQFYTEANDRAAFSGVTITNSRGRNALWRKGPPVMNRWVREDSYFTECTLENIRDVCAYAQLVRGCALNGILNDPCQDAKCVVGNSFDTVNNDPWAVDVQALTVQYTGAGAAATLELSGFPDAASRTLTAKVDGADVGTFAIQNSLAAFNANTNYTVQNVVDWLNSLAGWSATVIDDSRRASALSTLGNRGNPFTATDVKTAPLTLATHFDLHSDWYGNNVGGTGENVIVADNKAINLRCQNIFVAASSPSPKDFLFANNALDNRFDDPTGEIDNAVISSQMGSSAHSHVVMVHNSLPSQRQLLRADLGYNPDSYCLIANNSIRSIDWWGAADSDLAVTNNHLHAGKTIPSGATGTSTGGDHTSLYTDAANGDFAPQGDLASNKKPSALKYDIAGTKRGTLSAAGAVA